MEREQIAIDSEFIKLDSFLKFAGLAETGGQAKDAGSGRRWCWSTGKSAPCGAKSSVPGILSPPRIFPVRNSRSLPVRINSLSLENYRNIIRCDLTPGEGVNLIVGDNAQGKDQPHGGDLAAHRGEELPRRPGNKEMPRLDMGRGNAASTPGLCHRLCGSGRARASWKMRPGRSLLVKESKSVHLNGVPLESGAALVRASCARVVFSPDAPVAGAGGAGLRNAGISWTAPSASCVPQYSQVPAASISACPGRSAAPCSGTSPSFRGPQDTAGCAGRYSTWPMRHGCGRLIAGRPACG